MTAQDVSVKSTKNEILDAYHEVLAQLKESRKTSKQDTKREQDKQTLIQNASQHTTDEIVKNLADLKLSMVRSLETLEEQLLNEYKKLTTLQQAIAVQNQDIEEMYEIKINADTLAALLETQKRKNDSFEQDKAEQRQIFEKEMLEKRAQWKAEQEAVSTQWKEQELQQKKLRQREEEEYLYKRNLDRQKEQDQYLLQKQTLEKELAEKKITLDKEFSERESFILSSEQELQSLKAQVEEFPKKLQKAIEETERALNERLKFKYDYETKLTQKEVEGERKLHQQMIAALEIKIAQQEQQVKELSEKANHAGSQVQEIAVKAIEGASRQRFYTTNYGEKSSEAEKT